MKGERREREETASKQHRKLRTAESRWLAAELAKMAGGENTVKAGLRSKKT